MHALRLPPIVAPRVIGLDEWAWKRGQRYGAIVVDLERNKPIALLADRSKPTIVHWLKEHPTIQMVARDRSKEFAAALLLSPRPCPKPRMWPIGGISPRI
jgi:transposase